MRKQIFSLVLLVSVASASMADNWMLHISDSTPLCRISIPGTHDSATGEGMTSKLTTSFAKTQDLTLSEQWECGVRAFDLRPALKGEKLIIYHGSAQTKMSFDDALALICDKLVANPSECAIVIMQNEGGGDDNEWGRYVTASLDRVKSSLVDYRPNLTMGDMRGRLLVLNRNLYRPIPYGGVCQGWGNNAANNQGTIEAPDGKKGVFHVQDYYDVTSSGASDLKRDYIARMLNASVSSTTDHLYINHTSGYTGKGSLFGVPTVTGMRDNAANANTYLVTLLTDREQKECCAGLVMMDYAGVDASGGVEVNGARLVEAVISSNVFVSDPVSITRFSSSAVQSDVYDFAGRQIAFNSSSGLMISNGRKFVK